MPLLIISLVLVEIRISADVHKKSSYLQNESYYNVEPLIYLYGRFLCIEEIFGLISNSINQRKLIEGQPQPDNQPNANHLSKL